ncbi:MAG TPA: flagellar biosynthetic protein FliQ [Candidatus Angelobacter sp.]|jgi:flagellar biosynthetic protein FliQ|nr:flagellar biosynthetic protein FliQ [Candidatus Angelobacter sp.]
MNMEMVLTLSRRTLQEALLLSAPILIVGIVVSIIISVLQVMTSVQEVTISTVPRLAAVAGALFVTMPWMLKHMISFMTQLFGDFHPFLK